jgi:hypothetical protein
VARGGEPTGDPESPCPQTYRQRSGALMDRTYARGDLSFVSRPAVNDPFLARGEGRSLPKFKVGSVRGKAMEGGDWDRSPRNDRDRPR